MKQANLQLDVFRGTEASVNSYLFSNGHSAIVMDLLRNSRDASKLAELIKSKNVPLTHALITHGHPDHYVGMDVLRKEFPDVKIVVADQAIKDDIIGFSTWMESVGWWEAEPNLKPRSEANPGGFDYESEIGILDFEDHQFTLDGGGTLLIKTDYKPAEAEHVTTVFSEDLNALFSSDLCYNGVHLWLGQGVDQQHIDNWKSELNRLKADYTDPTLTVYPGHGGKSSIQLFDSVLQYLSDFVQVVAKADSKEQAMEMMKNQYPDWEQADFLLFNSVEYHMGLRG